MTKGQTGGVSSNEHQMEHYTKFSGKIISKETYGKVSSMNLVVEDLFLVVFVIKRLKGVKLV